MAETGTMLPVIEAFMTDCRCCPTSPSWLTPG